MSVDRRRNRPSKLSVEVLLILHIDHRALLSSGEIVEVLFLFLVFCVEKFLEAESCVSRVDSTRNEDHFET